MLNGRCCRRPFFILQIPTRIQRAEAELANLIKQKRASVQPSEERRRRKSHHADDTARTAESSSVPTDDQYEDNPILGKVRVLLETHESVGTLTWLDAGDHALILFAVTGASPAERVMKDLVSYGVGQEFGNLSLFNLDAQVCS